MGVTLVPHGAVSGRGRLPGARRGASTCWLPTGWSRTWRPGSTRWARRMHSGVMEGHGARQRPRPYHESHELKPNSAT